MKKIVICVPTYNRPEVIEELLLRCGELFAKYNYDLKIFDSSTDDKTKKVCESMKGRFNDISYHRFDSDLHSNLKVYRILQNEDLVEKYDYVWIYSDSIRWSEDALRSIRDELEGDYDFIIPDPRDVEKKGTATYKDNKIAYKDLAWYMTLYGATIVNTKAVLKDNDWDYYEEKYCVSDRINFSHLCFYFDKMCNIKKLTLRHLCINAHDFAASPLRKSSGWHKDTFLVWCKYWSNAMNALPEDYNSYKSEVIRKHGDYSGILVVENFKRLKEQKIFGIKAFIQYFGYWKKVTNISRLKLFKIAFFPHKEKKTDDGTPIDKQKIIELYKKYPNIYIYGCGYNGDVIAENMDRWNIPYKGFCVSNINDNINEFRGYKIKQYSEEMFGDEKCGIVLGLNDKNSDTILNSVIDKKFHDRVLAPFKK